MSDGLKVTCSAAGRVNVAFYQNAIPIIRELAIDNGLGRELSDVEIHLASEPPFLAPGIWRIDRIADQATHDVRTFDLKLDPQFLAGINAARRGEIRVHIETARETIADLVVEINLLPPSHWGGANSAPELLAAFVRPTDPSVDVILRQASGKLAAAGRESVVGVFGHFPLITVLKEEDERLPRGGKMSPRERYANACIEVGRVDKIVWGQSSTFTPQKLPLIPKPSIGL